MRRTILSAAAGAAIALTALPAGAAAISREDAAAQRLESRAIALINAATRAMRAADTSCVQQFDPEHETTVTHDAPSQAMRDTFALLRRPEIPADREFAADLPRFPFSFAEGVYIDWIRLARAADGSEHYLVIAKSRDLPEPLTRACLRTRHRLLVDLLDGAGPRLRRLTLSEEARLNRQEHPAGGFPAREVIFGFGGGAGGGGVDLARFRRHGLFGSSQRGSEDRSTVSGFVPDGVATIEAIYPERVSRGPHRPAIVYGEEIRLTLPVQDNVVAFKVDRPAEDAMPPQMIWRAADGTVVRTVREPR
ncbi:hypothetical protein VSS74_08055 [Conexibacter stalactiti]|uniref:Uncharacterized protein n=1 Tax=Conexibacter stalactiti TaxID=1940611 RepID=A0ABU4HM15_9ACTN|nr:hypothetical protein [Conexibacter stalactiti]MDW5594285.1 hypothetical protein [Conexibacter stalactiti]MEC5034927.1 hypothetical protein [Conexibacter stalactiti]